MTARHDTRGSLWGGRSDCAGRPPPGFATPPLLLRPPSRRSPPSRPGRGGRDVAKLTAVGHVAEEAAHDLARARLRQVVGPDHALGPGLLADPAGDVAADVLAQRVVAVAAADQRHERDDGLAGELV